ncbi:Septum-promoting GTP-binding protein 1 [Camellia lanceoleosa]|uniref:Septum-promoting GTP-binding protein 1 n=1 Tax=Camellia lanceoleosa TaxID=1840588 RepID=A0ACC0H9I9_9ERIC|nr:Septum-promoting GTP-binding protein 1 [Camellia lanceoleosa]
MSSLSLVASERGFETLDTPCGCCEHNRDSSDLVALKIILSEGIKNQGMESILIGTKFDDFVQLPIDVQWTIASQARAYARALNATLFFSSATYNINVNKNFKFITAKLFNLPWAPEQNLTIEEPIIDF